MRSTRFLSGWRFAIASSVLGIAGVAGVLRAIAFQPAEGDKHILNTEAGLTDAEREALHSDGSRDFFSRLSGWLRDFDNAKVDPRGLPLVGSSDDFVPPQGSFASAVDRADTVVLARATKAAFSKGPGIAVVTLQVVKSAKGSPPEVIEVEQAGGPWPGKDWDFGSAGLVSADSDPLILPGDERVLFLQLAPNGSGRYFVQPGSGNYYTDSGRIEPLDDNPFGDEARGLTVDEFLAAVAQRAQEP